MSDYRLPSGSIPRRFDRERGDTFNFACWVCIGAMVVLVPPLPFVIAKLVKMIMGVPWLQ